MAITVKHPFVSTVPDAADTSIVRPSNWNADHTISGIGTMAEQNANSVAITGGAIDGTTIGATTATTGKFTTATVASGSTTTILANNVGGPAYISTSTTNPDDAGILFIVNNSTDLTIDGDTFPKGGTVGQTSGFIRIPSAAGNAGTPSASVPHTAPMFFNESTNTLNIYNPSTATWMPYVTGALTYAGTWNASTNTPTLTSSVGTTGNFYIVSVAGSTNLNGITDWVVGDWAVFNGSAWQKVDNTDAVVSVNGQTGAVTITLSGLGAGTIATQNANAVTITGGTINGTTIGATTASSGVFTNLTANDNVILGASNTDTIAFNGRITTDLEPNVNGAVDVGTTGRNWRNARFTGDVSASSATLDTATITGSTTAGNALVRIEQTGAGYALLVEDSANPDATPFVVHESGGVSVGNTIDAGAGNLYVAGNLAGNIITAVTSFTGSVVKATSSAGLSLQNASGTTQMSMGAGGGDNLSIGVATAINPANALVNISPTGTGSVTVYPNAVGALDNMVIGANKAEAATVSNLSVSGTLSFDADQGTNGQVLTSQGTGSTPKWQTPTTGTVTSVSGTGTVSGISLSGTVTSSGDLTLGGSLDLSKPPKIGTDTPNEGSFTDLFITGVTVFDGQQGTAGQVLTSAGTGNTPTWTTPTTGTVTSVTGTAPVVSSGGATPAISMAASGSGTDGYLKGSDWTTFNNKANAFTYTTNYVPYGQGTTTPNQASNFTFDGTTQTAPIQRASNGIIVNNMTVSASYSIASGDSGMSVGPVTVASGQAVTVASGSRWVVL